MSNKTTYNVDAYHKHNPVKKDIFLLKSEAEEILLKVSELKDMVENSEIGTG
jgi:hypothetical protein